MTAKSNGAAWTAWWCIQSLWWNNGVHVCQTNRQMETYLYHGDALCKVYETYYIGPDTIRKHAQTYFCIAKIGLFIYLLVHLLTTYIGFCDRFFLEWCLLDFHIALCCRCAVGLKLSATTSEPLRRQPYKQWRTSETLSRDVSTVAALSDATRLCWTYRRFCFIIDITISCCCRWWWWRWFCRAGYTVIIISWAKKSVLWCYNIVYVNV